MSHKPYLDWMHAALDAGEAPLSPDQRAQLQEHLAACADCQAAWETLNAAERLLKSAPLAAPQAGFTSRFQARLAAERRQARPRAVWGALVLGSGAVGAAAIMLPLGVGVLWSVVQVLREPATSLALLSGYGATANLADTLLDALLLAARALAEWALGNPWVWLAAAGALAATAAWLYLIRKLVPEVLRP